MRKEGVLCLWYEESTHVHDEITQGLLDSLDVSYTYPRLNFRSKKSGYVCRFKHDSCYDLWKFYIAVPSTHPILQKRLTRFDYQQQGETHLVKYCTTASKERCWLCGSARDAYDCIVLLDDYLWQMEQGHDIGEFSEIHHYKIMVENMPEIQEKKVFGSWVNAVKNI